MDEVQDFAETLGLGEEAAVFLRTLPAEVLQKVIRGFDHTGTKDGNVFGRLQGFAKSVLAHHTERQQQRPAGYQTGPRNCLQQSPAGFYRQQQQQQSRGLQQGFADGYEADVMAYCQLLGLDEMGTNFFSQLTPDLAAIVMKDFNPSGTKDGNVFGRLLSFTRGIWINRLGLDGLMKQEVNQMFRGMPEEAQANVIAQFNLGGSKDGNILARLERFAENVTSRVRNSPSGFQASHWTSAGTISRPELRVRGREQAPGGQSWAASNRPEGRAAAPHQVGSPLAGQIDQLGLALFLDGQTMGFLHSVPEDVMKSVLGSFDPSGTKDGQVWRRLFGFLRSIWCQRIGLQGDSVEFLKGLPEDVQQVVIAKFDPSRCRDGNMAARLESFARSVASNGGAAHMAQREYVVNAHYAQLPQHPQPSPRQPAQRQQVPGQHHQAYGHGAGDAAPDGTEDMEAFARKWKLPLEHAEFLSILSLPVQTAVLSSFRASGTKDGNVWGRLFGFVRSVWSQKLGLHQDAFSVMRLLPQEAQMEIMMQFNGEAEDAGGVAQHILMQQAGMPAEQQEPPRHARGTTAGMPAEQQRGTPLSAEEHAEIFDFIARCEIIDGQMQEIEEFMGGLEPAVREVVLKDFYPSGSKDGNVLGRLQGFAMSVANRMKGGRNVRQRQA